MKKNHNKKLSSKIRLLHTKKNKNKIKKKKMFFFKQILDVFGWIKKKLKAKHFFLYFSSSDKIVKFCGFQFFSIFYKIVETVEKKQLSPSSKIMTSIFVSAISENHNLFFCHIIIIPRSQNYSSTINFFLISMKLYFK